MIDAGVTSPSKYFASSSTFTGAYAVRFGFLKPFSFGTRRISGIWPPSNPRRSLPRAPARPRPTRVRSFFEPSAGRRWCSFIYSTPPLLHFLHPDEMPDLVQHPPDLRPVVLDDAVADPVQPEPSDRVLLVPRAIDHAPDLRHPKPGHRRPPSAPRSGRPGSAPPPRRPPRASAWGRPGGPPGRGGERPGAACGAPADRRPPPSGC